MRKSMIWMAFAAIAAVSLMIGCSKVKEEETPVSNEPGSEIVFGASTDWLNGTPTRTEYSGKDQNNEDMNKNTSEYERIDWVAKKDRIRILCDAAVPKTSGADPIADYTIFDVQMDESDKKKSQAKIGPADNNSLQWGTEEHYFYALYPAPGMESNYNFADKTVSAANAKIESVTGNKAKITGVIPATQEVFKVGDEYKANMNYAYMYAATTATPGQSETVVLTFNPLFTALEITLTVKSGTFPDANLTKLELISTSTALTGTFQAAVDESGVDPAADINAPAFNAGTNDKITMVLPTEADAATPGIQLTETPVKFTFLCLPVQQTDLKLKLYFGADYASSKTLTLNTASGPIAIGACTKAYIRNLGVTGITYFITAQDPDELDWRAGTSTTARVSSYSVGASGTTAVPWIAYEYYQDEACTQPYDGSDATVKPSWLPVLSGNGSTATPGQTVSFDYEATPASLIWDSKLLPPSDFGKGSSASNYYNLSNPSGMTLNTIAESANSYIVNSPGYFRIPLVMGNGVKNNAINSNAITYQGSNGTNQTYFKDYKGNTGTAITSTYLHKSGSGVGTPTSAFIVWEDVENLIEVSETTNYTLAGTPITTTGSGDNLVYWLNFHVVDRSPADNLKGNAVIAVTDETGTVMWSWHIWVTDFIPKNYPGYPRRWKSDIAVTNHTNMVNTMTPMHLGWVPEGYEYYYDRCTVYVKIKQTTGPAETVMKITKGEGYIEPTIGRVPFFQWGRKDALWPSNGHTDNLWPNIYGKYLDYTNSPIESPQASLDLAIRNPQIFYHCVQTSDTPTFDPWTTEGFAANLWSAANTGTEYLDAQVIKTIYDPCPAGYHMPPSTAFNGFTTDGEPVGVGTEDRIRAKGDWDNGWHFYADPQNKTTIFFAASGNRHPSYEQTFNGVDYFGDVWSAIPINNHETRYLTFAEHYVVPSQHNSRDFGKVVRPVED